MNKREESKIEWTKLGMVDIEPKNREFAKEHARNLFLATTQEIAPHVINELMEISSKNDIEDLDSAIWKWMQKWHLSASWVRTFAWNSLSNCNKTSLSNSKRQKQFAWILPLKIWNSQGTINDVVPPEGLSAWNAETEPRSSYLGQAELTIESELEKGLFSDISEANKNYLSEAKLKIVNEYCDEVVKKYLDSGLWIRTAKKKDLAKIVQTTTLFQVLGMRISKIRKQLKGQSASSNSEVLSRSAISNQISNFLRLIELEKRVEKSGRPPGSKDSDNCHRQVFASLGIKT